MTEKIITTLRDSKKARWTALLIVSFTMMTGYYINYVISPLKPMLEEYFAGQVPILVLEFCLWLVQRIFLMLFWRIILTE